MLKVSPTDRVFILAGAGVSAESGIPTFRGISAASSAITVSAKEVTPLRQFLDGWSWWPSFWTKQRTRFSARNMTDAQELDTFVAAQLAQNVCAGANLIAASRQC